MKQWLSYLEAGASLSRSGNMDVKKASILLKANEWGRALQSLLSGLEKGDLDHPAEAYDLLGRIYIKLGKPELAEDAFSRRDNICKAELLYLA